VESGPPSEPPESLDESDDRRGTGERASIVIFTLIAALMAVDLVIDYRQDAAAALFSFESFVFVAALSGIVFNWRLRMAAQDRSSRLDHELAVARAEVQRWSADAKKWNRDAQQLLQGLGAAIDQQFERWGLTPAERDVALLQLKGLRHKAIAELRQTSERTVRQQALSIYRKSGLSGRNDLAAFFLEDLLLPQDQTSDPIRPRAAAGNRS